ncbi:hypothetical protein Tco_1060979, partial [Tanacetum coccineum]
MDEDTEKLVEGEEIDANKYADDMLNIQEENDTRMYTGSHKKSPEVKKVVDYMSIDEEVEEESTEAALIRKKMKGSLEIRDKLLTTPTRSSRTNIDSLSLDKEKLQEYTSFKPTYSSSKPETNHSKHIKGVIARMFHHMKKSFMPRKDLDAIGKTIEETLKLERENTKADIALMVVAAVRKEHERIRAELLSQVSNDSIAKRQRTSKKSTYTKGESSSSQTMEESPPSGLDALNDMIRSRCDSGEEHQYHLDEMKSYMESRIVWESRKEDLTLQILKELAPTFYSCERDMNAPPIVLVNKYLFYLKTGNFKTRKSCVIWERVHDYLLRLESYQVKVNLTAPKLIFPDIEEQKLYTITSFPFVGLIYENSKKEKRIMDIDEIPTFCDATLKRVLKEVIKITLDVKHGYADPTLS